MEINMLYVLPTEEGMPPRCLMGHVEHNEGEEFRVPTPAEVDESEMAVFSSDSGCWTLAGTPLPPELSELISDHARMLGVPGF